MIIQTTKELRPRETHDWYPTPDATCDAALALLPPELRPRRVLDPGAGSGPWGRSARRRWANAHITGVEIRPDVNPDPVYDAWHFGSCLALAAPKKPAGPFRDAESQRRAMAQYQALLWAYEQPVWPASQQEPFDLVIGNPPYRLAEGFARLALGLVHPGGRVVFLLRLAFLESQKRGDLLWQEYPPESVFVCTDRPSFTGNGRTDSTAYAVFVWRKGYTGQTFTGGWFSSKPGNQLALGLE